MEITRRTDYATRIMLELARLGDGARLSARALGELGDVSYPFARSIITDLATAGLVDARRGPGGGVALARPAADITLYDILEAIEGGVCLNPCLAEPGSCTRSSCCPVHGVWADAGTRMADYLRTQDLATLAANVPDRPVCMR